jgi:predicted transcriptional regulator YheO
MLKDKGTTCSALIGYRTKTSKGTELKSTTVFIRGRKGKIVGALCINIDTTAYVSAIKELEHFKYQVIITEMRIPKSLNLA